MGFRLVKVDALAGRSGVWGGRAFRLGVHDAGAIGQDDQVKLVGMFERFYGATSERAARAEHAVLFAEGGPYGGDHPILGPRDVRREGVEPGAGEADDRGGDAPPAPVPERRPADAGGGHERPAPDWGKPAPELEPPVAGDGERHPELVAEDIEDDGSIVLPEREPEPEPDEPAVVAQEPDLGATDIDLAEAVARLDPEDDGHWTAQGLPGLDALQEIVGHRVVRKEVDAVAKGYNRAGARAAKE